MSGTSADGVDAALLFTDGQTVVEAAENVFIPYSAELRAQILGLMQGIGEKAPIARALTQVHMEAVHALQKKTKTPAQAIGFHGQTIRHAPAEGITEQIGDAQFLADAVGLPVVFDFRSNDVAQGGQGAPLVPLYHAALAHTLPKPLLVVNIGGVANVTWIGGDDSLLAFDCGPGNALLDDWVHRHTGARYDQDGQLAAQGKVDQTALAHFLQDPFFTLPAPKSLDRNHFASLLASYQAQWNAADGAATLTAITAAAIVKACESVPILPRQILVTGGGRHNPTMMRILREELNRFAVHRKWTAPASTDKKAAGEKLALWEKNLFWNLLDPFLVVYDLLHQWPLHPRNSSFWKAPLDRIQNPAPKPLVIELALVEAVGWQGDMLEAQAFAYLTARSLQGLPLSLPTTTGVRIPVTGGRLVMPISN